MAKITLNNMSKLISEYKNDDAIIQLPMTDGGVLEITVKKHLKMVEMSSIVDNSVANCFTNEGFAIEYKDVMFLKNILEVMTNVPIPTKKSGQKDEHNKDVRILDIEKLQEWNIGNHLIETLEEEVPLIGDLRCMVDEKLEYQKQLIFHSNNTDELVDAVTTFLDSTTKTINGIGDLVGGLSVDSINEMVSKVAKDGGVDLSSLKGLLETGKKDVGNIINIEAKQ